MAPTAIRICCAAFRWTPVAFISAIVVWSYYAYVVQMCFLTVESIAEKVIYLLLYHPVLVMFVWSYAKTIFTPVGTVPKKFFLPKQDADRLMRETNEETQKTILIEFARNNNLPVQNRTHSGAPRYCEKCRCIKPDRCHHCSVCGTCVLKMDHHCPWVNNCVGFTTYKFFVMFLGYALVYCIYVALTSLKYFISFWSGGVGHNMGKFHILFLFFVAVMFAISLISLFGYHCYLTAKNRSTLGLMCMTVFYLFQKGIHKDMGRFHVLFLFFVAMMFGISLISLFGYHIYLTVKNRSTLESFRSPIFQSGPDKNGFSLGKYNNFIEIFGENKKLWFIPVFTSEGDGVTFQTQTTSSSSSYQTMGNTSPSTIPSSGDGVTYPTRTVDLDSDGLLADRQRWMEEGDLDSNIGNGYGSYNRQEEVRLGF